MFRIHVCLTLVALCSTLVDFCCVFIYLFLTCFENKLAWFDLVGALSITKDQEVKRAKHGTDHSDKHLKKTTKIITFLFKTTV